MALTNAQLLSRLRYNIHNDGSLSDDELYDFLTLGQERIVADSPHTLGIKQGTLSLTVAIGRSYDLATDFYEMRSMHYPAGNREILPVPINEWVNNIETKDTADSGEPEFYCVKGAEYATGTSVVKVAFDKTPAASYTVYYWYYWMPAAITVTDAATYYSPIAQIGFSELLLWAATVTAREVNDPDGAASAMQMYDRIMARYRAHNYQGAHYVPRLRPDETKIGGSTLRLSDHFPAGS